MFGFQRREDVYFGISARFTVSEFPQDELVNGKVPELAICIEKYSEEKTPESFLTRQQLQDALATVQTANTISDASHMIATSCRRGVGNSIIFDHNLSGGDVLVYYEGGNIWDRPVRQLELLTPYHNTHPDIFLVLKNFTDYFCRVPRKVIF